MSSPPKSFCPSPLFRALNFHYRINCVLGIDICRASRKLGVLNKVIWFKLPEHLCLLYKFQVRSYMDYCSHYRDESLSICLIVSIGCSGEQCALSTVPMPLRPRVSAHPLHTFTPRRHLKLYSAHQHAWCSEPP